MIISYTNSTITYPNCHNFSISFYILKKASKPIVQKVTLARLIVLKPKHIAYMAIYYVDLLKDRAFLFTSLYPATINVILDTKVPKIIVLYNPIDKLIKVNKRIHLSTIHDYKDTAHFIANFNGIIKALALASIVSQVLPIAQP